MYDTVHMHTVRSTYIRTMLRTCRRDDARVIIRVLYTVHTPYCEKFQAGMGSAGLRGLPWNRENFMNSCTKAQVPQLKLRHGLLYVLDVNECLSYCAIPCMNI